MNKKVQIFQNKKFGEVRGILINNEPYFIGKEIATVLGYVDTKSAIADHVDKEDRTIIQKGQIATLEIPNRGLTIINESGLYSLILSSKLPKAKQFKRWVTSEVLPQIRKTGGYIPIEKEMSEAEIMAKALLISQKTIEKKNELLKAKEKELIEVKEDLTKKDNFINQISESENSLKVADVAQIACKKGIKIGQNRLWQKLRDWGLIKKNSKYDPKQEYIERGYFEVVEGAKENSKGVFTYKTTKVLGKGQVYIIERLIKENMESKVS